MRSVFRPAAIALLLMLGCAGRAEDCGDNYTQPHSPCDQWDGTQCLWISADRSCNPGQVWNENVCGCVWDCNVPNYEIPHNTCDHWDVSQCAWVAPDRNCQAPYVWNENVCSCVIDCSVPNYQIPHGNCTVWDTAACEWISTEPPGGCPSGSTWNATSCQCEAVCVQPPYPQDGYCYLWDATACAWVRHDFTCDAYHAPDLATCSCVCVQPPYPQDGHCYSFDPAACMYVLADPICSPPYQVDYFTCACVCVQPPYPGGGQCYTWNGASCQWENHGTPSCPTNFTVDENCNCVCIPPPYPTDGQCYEWAGANCQWQVLTQACPAGEVRIDCICVDECAARQCPEYYVWSAANCQCVHDCGAPWYDPPAPSGYHWDASACEWRTNCSGGLTWDAAGQACICTLDPNAGPPCYTLETSMCQWVPPTLVCDYGYVLSANCQSCMRDCNIPLPPDPPQLCDQWSATACTWLPPPKPAGTCLELNLSTCQWEHKDTSCQPDYKWDEAACACLPCDRGIPHDSCAMWDPSTCAYLPVDKNCPAGSTWNQELCKCEPCTQPPGDPPACSEWKQEQCQYVHKATNCPAGQKWNEEQCQCVVDCSVPQYAQPNPCMAWSEEACDWVSQEPPGGCGEHMRWNSAECKCEPDPCDPANHVQGQCETWNPETCRYESIVSCEVGQEVDYSDCTCRDTCNGVPYDRAAGEDCCFGTIYVPGPHADCCFGTIYDPATQACCNGVIYDPSTEGCCYGHTYNLLWDQCCSGGLVIPMGEVCCGMWGSWSWGIEPTLSFSATTPKLPPQCLGSVTVTVNEPTLSPGTARRSDQRGCYEDDTATVNADHDVTWSVSGVDANPSSGSGTTATFTATTPGTAAVKFTAVGYAFDPNWFDTKDATVEVDVVKVEFDNVSDGDYIGDDAGGAKVYAAAKGTGDMTITLKVTPATAQLPANFVTWSGGTAGASQLERKVSKASLAEQGIPVTANACNTQVYNGKHYVFEGRPQSTAANINITETQDNTVVPESAFGKTKFQDAETPTLEYGIYYESASWHFWMKKVEYDVKWGINGWGKPDITGPVSPFPFGVDDSGQPMPANKTEAYRRAYAKADLAPDALGQPSRTMYWSSDLTKRHELYHVHDWKSNHAIPKINEANSDVQAVVETVTVNKLAPAAVLSGKKPEFDEKYMVREIEAWKAFEPKAEERAYGDGKASYQALSDSLFP